jgi:hypothetical protein
VDTKQLPARPSLEQYKKQAKDLVKNRRSGDPSSAFSLADAQFAIAREHGFESWSKFAKHVREVGIPETAQEAIIAGDAMALEQRFGYSGSDAQAIVARSHHFENWAGFTEFDEVRKRRNSPVAQFEAAVDAIVAGNVAKLGRLLGGNPELVRARSMRNHHATLLHYVAANGVEDFRQKTPKNIVRIAEMLLAAGARIDAEAGMYGGGSKTMGLVATSIHPLLAGVLEPLIAVLLEHGATVDTSIVRACLANGRLAGAELMANHGAMLDLECACGIGRLDLVESFFGDDGALKSNATKAQMRDGFAWACEYGRTAVVELLLERGMAIGEKLTHRGETGLHWAAHGAHLDIVTLLLERHAPVNVQDDIWGNTPLGWALHGWGGNPRDGYYEVVRRLLAGGALVKPEWLADEQIRADARMVAALRGESG